MFNKPHSNLYEKTEFKDIREAIRYGIEKYSNCVAFTLKHKEGKEVTYTDIKYKKFGEEINNLGTGLIKLGLKDKRIAIIGPNSYEWILSYIAVLSGVGIVVPLDKGLPPQEIEDSIVRSEADCIIFDEKYIDTIDEIKKNDKTKLKQYICMQKMENSNYTNIDDIKEQGSIELLKGNTSFIDAPIDAEKASIILFTSGTTSFI